MDKKIVKVLLTIIVIVILLFGYFKFFRTYSVIFDSQGGTWYETQQVRINTKADDPGEPILIGYKFLGWYNGDEKYDFNEAVTKDITLTAKWEKVEEKE